ncbi:FAD-NAD(P)-binding-domain-containing protein [Xylaria nigripes]|nr:FAD-NAD(P)-binding-domain-containing protein [Xylaria nigripes]
MGPRGTSTLERLCASGPELVKSDTLLVVHVIDPASPGSGAVWAPSQPPELLMNSVARSTSLFTDTSVSCSGPIRPGPSLYEWAAIHEPEQATKDYATRAQYGRYLEWVFKEVVKKAPSNIRIRRHTARAVRLDDAADGSQKVTLSTGNIIPDLSAVVLAQGHLPVRPDSKQKAFMTHADTHNLRYILPANPPSVDLSPISADEPVLLRGLGLIFIDYMIMLTEGRGGRFVRTDGRLTYQPSGKEPRLYAGSRRGVPYRARGDSEPGVYGRHQPVIMTDDVISRFRERANTPNAPSFQAEIWPLVAKEVETVYYEGVLRQLGLPNDGFRLRFLADPYDRSREAKILDEFGIPKAQRWSWELIQRPYSKRTFPTASSWQRWLLAYMREDVIQARLGIVTGPLMAALNVMRDLRRQVRLIIDRGGLTGSSRRDELDRWFTPLNSFLSIGPPRLRVEQVVALIEAGTLEVLPPGLEVEASNKEWIVSSRLVPSHQVPVTTIIEARMPEANVRNTADELLNYLLKTGQCRPHNVDGYEPGGIDTASGTYRLIDSQGREHPKRFAIGVPIEGWAPTVVPRPNTNSSLLRQGDTIARGLLSAATGNTNAIYATGSTGDVDGIRKH